MRVGSTGLCVCLLAACSAPPEAPPAPPLDAPPVDTARIELADAISWPHRRTADADLDGDGAAERLVLSADVTVDAAGRPLWEDGHRWALVVEDGDARTLLYGAFVPNGHVEAAVLAEEAGSGRRHVLVRERTPQHARTFVIAYAAGAAGTVSAAGERVEQWVPSLTAP